ncbi:MAG TPA: epoxyqueuosine reductase QueH, partial [Caldisericia bacterium]|nr:epoxyqueuosine reductase QueH [Caldisericia bacterium]
MEKLLLHTCCAPCLVSVIDFFKEKFELFLYFYNPNIHPYKEYEQRSKSFKEYVERIGYKYIIGEYDYKDYFFNVSQDIENRCIFCYQLRLNETAKMAKELKINNFTTTMIYSIYQNHSLIKKIGEILSKEYDLNFVYYDLRNRYFEDKK